MWQSLLISQTAISNIAPKIIVRKEEGGLVSLIPDILRVKVEREQLKCWNFDSGNVKFQAFVILKRSVGKCVTNCKGVAKHARGVVLAVVTLFYLSKLKEKGERRKKSFTRQRSVSKKKKEKEMLFKTTEILS